MKKKKRILISLGIVMIGILVVVGLSRNQQTNDRLEGEAKGILVNVDKAGKNHIQTKIVATGTVSAKDRKTVFAKANTKVKAVKVAMGDEVKAGDVLVAFDEETRQGLQRELEKLQIQLDTARIGLKQLQGENKQSIMQVELDAMHIHRNMLELEENKRQIEVNLQTLQKELEEVRKNNEVVQQLYKEGLASQKELEDTKKAVQSVKDQITTLEVKNELLQKQIDTTILQKENTQYTKDVLKNKVEDEIKQQNIAMKRNEVALLALQKDHLLEELSKIEEEIKAPMDGVVVEVLVEEGQWVSTGAPLIKMIDDKELIVEAEISPYYAAQLEKGLVVEIKYHGSTTVEVEGSVTRVSPVATMKKIQNKSASSTAIPVEITLKDKEGLKEGLTVDLRIITADVKDVIAVPLLATMTDDEGDNYLFVVQPDYQLEKRKIKQGASDNRFVQVSDVKVGELVVTNPTEALQTGTYVKFIPLQEVGE